MTKWPIVTLSELCDIQIGRTPSRAEPRFWGPGKAWLSIADMNQGRELCTTKETITDLAVEECRCRVVAAGTLVFSFKLSVGKVGVLQSAMCTNEAIAALPIRDSGRLESAYLYHALRALDLRGVGEKAVKGVTLNTQSLARLKIPLPPLAEQRRIAAMLDLTDRIRRNRREASRGMAKLLAGAYDSLVGPKNKHYVDWPEQSLADLAERNPGSIRTGPFGSALRHSEFIDRGVAVLGIDNAVRNRFAWAQRRFISDVKFDQFRRYEVKPGDVIITIMGTTGRSAVVPEDIPRAISTKHLAVITPDRTRIIPLFLSHAIHSNSAVSRQISSANYGAIMAGLSVGIIKRLRVRLPPLEIQEQFASVVRTIYQIMDRMEDASLRSDRLRGAVEQLGFRE